MVERWNTGRGDDTRSGIWATWRSAIPSAGHPLASLAGRKHLVAGNDDPPEIRTLPGWTSVPDYPEIESGAPHRPLPLSLAFLERWHVVLSTSMATAMAV